MSAKTAKKLRQASREILGDALEVFRKFYVPLSLRQRIKLAWKIIWRLF